MEREPADPPRILDDDGTLVELLFERPDLFSEDLVLLAEARAGSESGAGGRIVVGWRRAGGPVVVGVTTGLGSEALLVEALGFAGSMKGPSLARWNQLVRRYWSSAPPELAERVGSRWSLPLESPWEVGAWTRAVWGVEPAGGRCAVALVATRIPVPCERAIAWLAERETIAAFRIRWYGEDAAPTPRLERVVGEWKATGGEPQLIGSAAPSRPAPVSVGEFLVARIEALCADLGCRVSRRGEEWVRFDGIRRSMRGFPGPGELDLQLVGIDEGSLIGLGFRYGVALGREAPPGAPPGTHLRLSGGELEPEVLSLLTAWLGGADPTPASAPRPARPSPEARSRNPRNPARPNRPR